MAGNKKEYPYKWVELTQKESDERSKLFKPFSVENPVVCSVPDDVIMPKKFAPMAEQIYNMEVRPDDIWIITYPKCGTTWTQELVWQVVNGVNLNPDREPFTMRSPFIEVSCLNPAPLIPPTAPVPQEMIDLIKAREPQTNPRMICDSVSFIETMKGPRVLKSHLPLEMLPPNLLDVAKVIYVCRNPRDVCVSFFHHTKLIEEIYHFQGEFQDYAELFLQGKVNYGSYWHHLKSGWAKRDHPNMMFLWYEDMKKDLVKVINDVCSLTGYNLTQEKILQLDDALFIDNFRKMAVDEKVTKEDKEMFGKFIRKGKVGDFKTLIQGDLEVKFKKWIAENTQGTNLPKFDEKYDS